ncbi:MAG: prepilin-type N-terminal cleavage/methylation domain-containing protein [Lachnospiraceae bacterium]|nr:prepilin-type N-terminal cleavage/methylation domain-containing protein [Lachnospiraceae bacterium]
MRKRNNYNCISKNKDNSGFTLVEIVVVVVILVIISTMIIPTMASYFKKNRSEKIEEQAEAVFQSASVLFMENYANNTHNVEYTCIIEGKGNDNKTVDKYNSVNTGVGLCMECDMHLNPIADEMITLSGMSMQNDDPCTVIVGLGRYDKYADPLNPEGDYDLEKAYHVYLVIFQPIFKQTVYYYMNGELYDYWPFEGSKERKNIKVDGVDIQLYYIKNGKDNNNPATTMWGVVKDYTKQKP